MLIGLSARPVAIPASISSGALSARTTSRPDQPLGASFAAAPNVKAVTEKIVPIIRFWAQLGADTTSAANVPRSAQSTGIKSADFDDRPCYIVAGPKISAAVYHCATLPVDPDIAARVNASSNWGRIRKEIAWSKPRLPAPKEMQSDWTPCSPSVLVADDLGIPDFLKREPAAVSESPEGLLVAAE
jgi:hypothetical protein